MEEKINFVKVEIISSYINQIQTALNEYDPVFEKDKEIFDLLIETANVFEEDIPQIKKSILLRSGTEIRDAYTAVGLLKLYLADNGIKYFSEDMINSSGLMEKKSSLDFLIDALQYLVSIQEGNNKEKKYSSMALNANSDTNSKVYAVIKQEIRDLMKMSNEYFDIRHNDYLNDAKEAREALNDSHFIEYLYNRAYSLLYVLRLKTKTEPQSLAENSE